MPSLLFSVIIPVYNDEKNIPRCLDSVIGQSFEDFECLIIDDGSADSTSSICDSYAQKDSRFRVFHKENEGISKTRQFGIDKVSGKYIIFVDSDDWIDSLYLENIKCNNFTNEPDIIFFDFFEENNYAKEKYISQYISVLKPEIITQLALEGKIFSCLWNITIKNDFYKKIKINFNENINYGEDTLFIIELLLNNPVIENINRAFYHHTCNYNSFTRKNKKNRFFERIRFLNELDTLLRKYKRTDLIVNNFFPYNDKFEMLFSGVLSRKEYQSLFTLSFTQYYREHSNFLKYFFLFMAETRFYFLAKFFVILGRRLIK